MVSFCVSGHLALETIAFSLGVLQNKTLQNFYANNKTTRLEVDKNNEFHPLIQL